ncbi:DUF2330 domain-containing protein [Candidatus Fermentibacteria bacterium]|nr:DUF2330 domain-containing protein [Candidatus Fermentibacteria bacterium]
MAIEDVSETGENGEDAFEILDLHTAPVFRSGGGCFPAGTEVIATVGLRSIETVDHGTDVYAFDLASGEWVETPVLARKSFRYQGDMISIHLGDDLIQATGNQPFYVMRGEGLALRPQPEDIPDAGRTATKYGRWVEARDLRAGDILRDTGGAGLVIAGLSRAHATTEVFCLEIEHHHNCAVHRLGVLAHNGKASESSEEPATAAAVTLYGNVVLEHYEVSVVGAADATALLAWLEKNGYQASPDARGVLDAYIDKGWAFAAVKLNPGDRRHYENTFPPPLTLQYQHDRLIFPLHISSVSTTQAIRITLYVIAESTVSSPNFPTRTLKYDRKSLSYRDPKSYVEACIRDTMGDKTQAMVVIWRGKFYESYRLRIPFRGEKRRRTYLTRLETRIEPAALREDVELTMNLWPRKFRVHYAGTEAHESFRNIMTLLLLAGLVLFWPAVVVVVIVLVIRRIKKRRRQPSGSPGGL